MIYVINCLAWIEHHTFSCTLCELGVACTRMRSFRVYRLKCVGWRKDSVLKCMFEKCPREMLAP